MKEGALTRFQSTLSASATQWKYLQISIRPEIRLELTATRNHRRHRQAMAGVNLVRQVFNYKTPDNAIERVAGAPGPPTAALVRLPIPHMRRREAYHLSEALALP